MISTEGSTNKCKTKVTKNTHSTVTFSTQLKEVINVLAPKLTQQEKIEFEFIHIWIKKTLHVRWKQNVTCI